MDGVSAASSIIAIIGVAGEALKAINWLRDFCEEFATDRKSEFLNDLTTVAATLTNVKSLCDSVQNSKLLNGSDFRTNALAIQVDDCAKDLAKWVKIAERLKEREQSDKLTVFSKFRSVWSSFVNMAVKSSHGKLYDRLRWHQHNIEMNLAVFGRKFDLINTSKLHQVGNVTEVVHQKICDEADNVLSRLDSLSASNSSLLSGSRSTTESLKELSADLREVKEVLLDMLSTSSSRSSSASNGERSVPQLFSSTTSTHLRNGWHDKIDSESSANSEQLNEDDHRSRANSHDYGDNEPEFEALAKSTHVLVDALRNLYHPVLAEYISTTNALQVLQLYRISLGISPSVSATFEFEGHRSVKHTTRGADSKLRKVAIQLLGLRSLCSREGLIESLRVIDLELGIDANTITQWERMADKTTPATQTTLTALKLSNIVQDGKFEASARMAEWMLEVVQSSTDHQEVCELIYLHMIWKTSNTEINNTQLDDPKVRMRQMLKYWFVDSPELSLDGLTDSVTGFTHSSGGTDATIIPINTVPITTGFNPLDAEIGVLSDLDGPTEPLPPLLRSVETPRLSAKTCKSLTKHVLEPPPISSHKKLRAAQDILRSYEAEPPASLPDLNLADNIEVSHRSSQVQGRKYDLVFSGVDLVPRLVTRDEKFIAYRY